MEHDNELWEIPHNIVKDLCPFGIGKVSGYMRHDKELWEIPDSILKEVSRVVIGKEKLKRKLIVALIAGGHVLIEGETGTGKTLLAKSFAQATGGIFKRIQLTPDLLPADITGFNLLYRSDERSEFVPGPIFANVVVADELNRTTPRTQSAFLEAMQESQVTVEGVSHQLPMPFMVVASQIPYGSDGTYPLTDVQLDRFMFRLWSDYPSRAEASAILDMADALEQPKVSAIAKPEDILRLRNACRSIHVAEVIRDYILAIVEKVKAHPDVRMGPSQRASLFLYRGIRALALLERRDFAIPDDVQELVVSALAHHLHLKPEAEADEVLPTEIVEQCLAGVAVPKGEYKS